MIKVSVIIPTYNRFDSLTKAIDSILTQTYKNIEILVINDGSTQSEYYDDSFAKRKDIKVIHLKPNSRELFEDKSCITNGIIRNIGINFATGDYIAFLDDDDVFMPEKIEFQLKEMITRKFEVSCTDGYIGYGDFDKSLKYQLYNGEYFFNFLLKKYNYSFTQFPTVWNQPFLQVHNCVITSSIMIKKELLLTQQFRPLHFAEDYDLWLRLIENSPFLYIDKPLFYYRLK